MTKAFNILVATSSKDFFDFIKNCSKKANVIHVVNGILAFETAIESPSLNMIIAEYALSQRNGLQLCGALKFDYRTKDIPFLLFSEHEVETEPRSGVEIKPDYLFTMPFDKVEVTEKIKYYIEQSSTESKKQLVYVDVKLKDEFAIVEKILEHNVLEENFSVEQFAQQMNMSRMNLYRQIKNIYKLSPSELIKKKRIEHAADLLKTSSLSISEIAFQSGFTQVSYFSKCFKKFYNCSPSEYRN